jgi:hypothetical protein
MEAKDQLKEVQSVIDRLTRFRHINGWAVLAAGIIATIGFIAISLVFHLNPLKMKMNYHDEFLPLGFGLSLAFFAMLLLTGIICGVIVLLSLPKDLTRHGWRNLVRLVGTLSLYLLGGAVIAYRILEPAWGDFNNILIMPAFMCLLYGLGLLHISYFSDGIFKYSGIYIFACGCVAALIPSYSWLIWLLAFGLGHVFTGLIMIKNRAVE